MVAATRAIALQYGLHEMSIAAGVLDAVRAEYPATFHHAGLVVLTKTDLLPYVPFHLELARENARRVQPEIEILELSCTSGDGLDRWYAWIERHL